MTEDNLSHVQTSIAASLKQMSRIGAYTLIDSEEHRGKSNVEKIMLLNRLGFDMNDIAEIVNTTVGTVAKELSIARKKEKQNDRS
jgi:hypothetical protein